MKNTPAFWLGIGTASATFVMALIAMGSGMSANFGSIADWLAAVGTVFAVWVAVLQSIDARKESNKFQRNQKIEKAISSLKATVEFTNAFEAELSKLFEGQSITSDFPSYKQTQLKKLTDNYRTKFWTVVEVDLMPDLFIPYFDSNDLANYTSEYNDLKRWLIDGYAIRSDADYKEWVNKHQILTDSNEVASILLKYRF